MISPLEEDQILLLLTK